MRLTLSRPGAAEPYARIDRPQTAVPETVTVLLGGNYDLRRGGFGEGGAFRLNLPPAFQHGDWLRLYWELDGDPIQSPPDYAGEVLGEPWREGGGEIQTRGLDEKLRACRWTGRASGDFPTFFRGVLDQTTLPAGFGVAVLPDIPGAVFEADTPFELLGDTIQAITPALGGQLIGVNTSGLVFCADPDARGLTRRFVWGQADMPAGSTNNYANCVRFSFEYPSSDKGQFEGRNEPEIERMNGSEVWAVEQVTARELGRAAQPYATGAGQTSRTFAVPGQPAFMAEVTRSTGDLLADLRDEAGARPDVVYRPTAEAASLPFDVARLYGMGAASVVRPHLNGVREAAIATVQFAPETPLEFSEGAEIVDTRGQITLILTGTFDPAIPPHETVVAVFRSEAGDLLDYAGGTGTPRLPGWDAWTPGPGGAGFVLTFPLDVAGGMVRLGYKASFLNAQKDAGKQVAVLELRAGGRFRAELEAGEVPSSPTRSFTLELRPSGEYQPRVEITAGVRQGNFFRPSQQATLPYPLTSGDSGGSLSPLVILRNQMVQGGNIRLEFGGLLTLPYGSSIELRVKPGGGAVGGVWVLPGGSAEGDADSAYAGQYGTTFAAATEVRARSQVPPTFTALTAVEDAADGWKRFAVRGPQDWDGLGTVPDLTGKTLLLLGVSNIMDLRMKTPELGNLAVYGAELLRYRAEPVREWTGHVRTLERVDAAGQVAFEGLTGPDVLLDVQRVKVDLDNDRVEVVCGSPLPSTNASAIAGKIRDIQRVARRAGSE